MAKSKTMRSKLWNSVKATVFVGAVFLASAILEEFAEFLDGKEVEPHEL